MTETVSKRLQTVEYTYHWYREFLGWLESDGYRFGSFDEPVSEGEVLLRHDVDLSVESALEMARIEAEQGVRAAYFFQVTSPLYNLFERETRDSVLEIEALGHDVGLHFNTHQYWPHEPAPDQDVLASHVAHEHDILASIAAEPLRTVSFHIPPKWVLDRSFDGFRSSYEPAFLSEIGYRADSNGRWRDDPPTDEELPRSLQILTHPGLWGEGDATFEECIEHAVASACQRTRDRAVREFVTGVYDR